MPQEGYNLNYYVDIGSTKHVNIQDKVSWTSSDYVEKTIPDNIEPAGTFYFTLGNDYYESEDFKKDESIKALIFKPTNLTAWGSSSIDLSFTGNTTAYKASTLKSCSFPIKYISTDISQLLVNDDARFPFKYYENPLTTEGKKYCIFWDEINEKTLIVDYDTNDTLFTINSEGVFVFIQAAGGGGGGCEPRGSIYSVGGGAGGSGSCGIIYVNAKHYCQKYPRLPGHPQAYVYTQNGTYGRGHSDIGEYSDKDATASIVGYHDQFGSEKILYTFNGGTSGKWRSHNEGGDPGIGGEEVTTIESHNEAELRFSLKGANGGWGVDGIHTISDNTGKTLSSQNIISVNNNWTFTYRDGNINTTRSQIFYNGKPGFDYVAEFGVAEDAHRYYGGSLYIDIATGGSSLMTCKRLKSVHLQESWSFDGMIKGYGAGGDGARKDGNLFISAENGYNPCIIFLKDSRDT